MFHYLINIMFRYLKGGCKEDGDSLLQVVPWKRWKVMGTSYSWGYSSGIWEENFSQQDQSAVGIIFPGNHWIPQHWILVRHSWRGSWAVLSRLCFPGKVGPNDPWGLFQPGVLWTAVPGWPYTGSGYFCCCMEQDHVSGRRAKTGSTG